MAVNLNDRPIETVRSEVIDQLIMNYSHGELSYEAFERRLEQAMELANNQALADLTADLPLAIDKAFVESKKQDFSPNYIAGDTEELDSMVSIFGGNSRGGEWKVAKEIKCVSLFSGTSIDFTHAQFSQETVRLTIFSLFSGDAIYVPENVRVVSKVFCIFGSIDNSAPNQINLTSSNHKGVLQPTIIIEGFSIFSGVSIKLKRSMKERLVELAGSMKKMFSS